MTQEINYLYKYYSCEAYNLDALANGYLWFSNPKNLNDPFDCNFEGYRESIAFSAFKTNHFHKMYELFESFGICSFTQEPTNQHFWSLYSANYSGFCLVFDKMELEKKLLSIGIIMDDAIYLTQPINIESEINNEITDNTSDSEFKHILEQPLRKIAFIKNKDVWANENEFRAFLGGICIGKIASGENDVEKLKNGYKVPIKKNNLLKEIILGHNITTENKALIINLIQHNFPDIKLSQIELDFKNLQLKVVDVSNL